MHFSISMCKFLSTVSNVRQQTLTVSFYRIVGEEASSRPAEFASALVFAHEYGILAASLQDRPFIPKSFVAIGGVPDACKTAFRKWDPRTLQASPQVLPLNAAIEAIRS